MPAAKQTSSVPLRRHDLLHIAPDAWASALALCPSLTELPLVASWAVRGWPVIVRRYVEGENSDLVPVGLPLPPAVGKRRVALLLPRDGILQCSSPPPLSDVATIAHPAWRSTITSLLALGGRIGVEPLVFGSLLWQHQTGLPYLSASSDLDILWRVPAGFDVCSLLSSVAEIEGNKRLPIDGEIIFSDGYAVNWRELRDAYRATDRMTVLAKSKDGVQLLDLDSLAVAGQHA